MKVILLRDVAKIGKRYSEVEVPTGFAQNKLIPAGDAMPATPQNRSKVARQASRVKDVKEQREGNFKEAVTKLGEVELVLLRDANEKEHLFEAVHAEEVVELAESSAGVTLKKEQVVFSEPIKSLGEHTVSLKEGDDVFKLKIIVKAK